MARRLDRALWNAQRLVRRGAHRFGVTGWVVCALILGCIGLSMLGAQLARDVASLRARLHEARERPPLTTAMRAGSLPDSAAAHADGRARLKAFADHLLPHDDIPATLEDVLRLAADSGLTAQRGDYRAQADLAGEFLRYRMSLPVRGPAPAVHRFMQSALLELPSLALESVQFKRDRTEATEIEARIQWVVFARLPPSRAGPVATISTERILR